MVGIQLRQGLDSATTVCWTVLIDLNFSSSFIKIFCYLSLHQEGTAGDSRLSETVAQNYATFSIIIIDNFF